MPDDFPVSAKLRETLRGCPDSTLRACAEFQTTGEKAALDRAVLELVQHHLHRPPPQPLAAYPGTTALVAELGLDSFTMVELVFIFEDLFGAKPSQAELMQVVTIDDLRELLHRHVSSSATA